MSLPDEIRECVAMMRALELIECDDEDNWRNTGMRDVLLLAASRNTLATQLAVMEAIATQTDRNAPISMGLRMCIKTWCAAVREACR